MKIFSAGELVSRDGSSEQALKLCQSVDCTVKG